ncbi:zf-TFIIB domain-containing protein [Dactylosporangium sp. CS-033363]|uniref:TFIIB-type zinc ribbon-containing protein n=1 Tax=Dactylosporangium sp. CS-033363 TaxID=3239935 RepID=UPI003D92895D
MTCPKCRGEMRQFERSGVTVDQCLECRGIFLDRGELERLVDAEQAWQGRHQPQASHGGYPQQPYQQQPYQQQPYPPAHGGYGHYGHHKKHRRHHRESFFGELFD